MPTKAPAPRLRAQAQPAADKELPHPLSRQSMLKVRIPKLRERKRREIASRECPAHRAWVRRHYCSVPGCQRLPIECAHIRGGTDGGMALKPSDRWLISLCSDHHGEQHRLGERHFEKRYGIDLAELAEEFARRSPHRDKLLPPITPVLSRTG